MTTLILILVTVAVSLLCFNGTLDADALNQLAKAPFSLPDHTLLTPHAGEAARLLHADTGTVQQLGQPIPFLGMICL